DRRVVANPLKIHSGRIDLSVTPATGPRPSSPHHLGVSYRPPSPPAAEVGRRAIRMYESFFGLRRRPFAASPDADVLVETAAVADAVERLDLCVRQGRGIGVLTAAAGMGKTHLCHRLARVWGADFRV